MRGGKLTTHAGSKHGLGGKSFRKGTQVGRQVMADSLDQRQPIMELTFSADAAHQKNHMVPANSLAVISNHQDDWQRLAIAYQQSPHAFQNEINVDLHKLTRPAGRHQHHLGAIVPPAHSPNLPGVGVQNGELSPNTIERQISKYVTTKMPTNGSIDHLAEAADGSSPNAILMRNMQLQMPRTASHQSIQQSEMQREDHSQNQFVQGPKLESRPIQTQTRGQDDSNHDRSVEPSDLTSNPSHAIFELGKPPAKHLASMGRDGSEHTLILDGAPGSKANSKKKQPFTPLKKRVETKVSKMRVFDASNLNQAPPVDPPPKRQTTNRFSKYGQQPPSKQQSPKISNSPPRQPIVVVNNTASQASFAPFSGTPSPKRFVSNQSIVDYQDKLSFLGVNPSQSTLLQGANDINTDMHQQTFGQNFGNVPTAAKQNNVPSAQKQLRSRSPETSAAPETSSFEIQKAKVGGQIAREKKLTSTQNEDQGTGEDEITGDELKTVIKDPKRFAEALANIRAINDQIEQEEESKRGAAEHGSDSTSGEDQKNRESELHHGMPTTEDLNITPDEAGRDRAKTLLFAADAQESASARHDSETDFQVKVQYTRAQDSTKTANTPREERPVDEASKGKDVMASPSKSVLLNDQFNYQSMVNSIKIAKRQSSKLSQLGGDDSDTASVQRALNQIESLKDRIDEADDEGIFIEVQNQQIGIQGFPSLTKLDENCFLERYKPVKKPREVLPPAIVDLSSGVQNQEYVSPKGQKSPPAGPSLYGSDAFEKGLGMQLSSYDQTLMNRTTFVEHGAKVKNFSIYKLDPAQNAQAFRNSCYPSQKKNNHMLRTTLAFKDGKSSDTVSTEHNYLQPTIKKIGSVGGGGKNHQRASILNSSENPGSIIHVQEHNLESNPTERDGFDASHTSNRHLMVNQESQILFDAPAKNIAGKSTPLGLTPSMSQLSQLPIISLMMPVQGVNRGNMKNATSQVRALSKLSVDMRASQKSPGSDLKAVQEPDTAIFPPKDTTMSSPTNRFNSTDGFKKKPLKTTSPAKQIKQIFTFAAAQKQELSPHSHLMVKKQMHSIVSADLDTPIQVGGSQEVSPDASPRALVGKLTKFGINHDKSSKLLKNAASVDNMVLQTITSPGRAAIIASSNPNTSAGQKSQSPKNLGKMTFKPTPIQIFEPNLELNNGMLSKQSSKESPRFLKKDSSNNSSVLKSKKDLIRQQQQPHQSPQMAQSLSSDTIEVKKFAIKDKSLHQPNFLTQSSLQYSNISEEQTEGKNNTQQSFTTIIARQNQESPNKDLAYPFNDTKMSNLMPAIFSTSFSQTYADLMKKVSPHEVKSEFTESEFAYPSPVFRGSSKKKKVIREKVTRDESPIRAQSVEIAPDSPQKKEKPVHPEILFYLKVLERIQKTHKDVKVVEQLRELRKAYTNYLGEGGADNSKGIFANIQSHKMSKPMMTISMNDLTQDPEMLKKRIEMSVNKQYNIAAIMAEGVDNLPRRWKKLSPLNRLNKKIKIGKTLSKLTEEVSHDIVLPNKTRAPTHSPKKLFKSLISSQEIEVDQLPSLTTRSPNFSFQQTLFSDLNNKTTSTILSQREYAKSPLDLKPTDSSLPHQWDKLKLNQVSQSLDFSKRGGAQQVDKEPIVLGRQRAPLNNLKKQAHTLSLEIQSIPVQSTSGSPTQNAKGTTSAKAVAFTSKPVGGKRDKDYLTTQRLQEEDVVLQNEDEAFLTQPVVKEASSNRSRSKQVVATSQEFTIGGDLSLRSKDPAANPRSPKSFLLQDSQFSDLLAFGTGTRRGLKERVGPRGFNPFLEEIEERLRNPDGRTALLQKSIITRQDPNAQKRQWQPAVAKDKTIKVATKDIYQAIRVQKSIPLVPLHRMDTISKNLTMSLLHENSKERIPMHEWKKQQVMLPILNTARRDITLHTTAALCTVDIQRQKRVDAFDQASSGLKKIKQRKQVAQSLDVSRQQSHLANQFNTDKPEDMKRKRTSTMMSIMSLLEPVVSGRNSSSLQHLSKTSTVKTSTFNNQKLREATEESPTLRRDIQFQQQ